MTKAAFDLQDLRQWRWTHPLLALFATLLFWVSLVISEESGYRLGARSLIELTLLFLFFFCDVKGISILKRCADRRFIDRLNSPLRYAVETAAVLVWNVILVSPVIMLPLWLVVRSQARELAGQEHLVALMFRQLYTQFLLFGLLLYLLITAYHVLVNAYRTTRQAEQLKKENVQRMFEMLRNQVNPHFLFNSLNALSVLIYRDKEQAARFVDELSLVYRYVLDQKDKELVSLSHEFRFLEAYLYLLRVRYRESLVAAPLPALAEGYFLPPLTLQTLVDNALRYNIATREQPLHLAIEAGEDGVLIVRNSFQPRERVDGNSAPGLSALVSRFSYLTDRPIRSGVAGGFYEVHLPLLEME